MEDKIKNSLLEVQRSIKCSLEFAAGNKNFILTNIAIIEAMVIIDLLTWIDYSMQDVSDSKYLAFTVLMTTTAFAIVFLCIALFYFEKYRRGNKRIIKEFCQITEDYYGIKEKLED